jgi:hypothetical protein
MAPPIAKCVLLEMTVIALGDSDVSGVVSDDTDLQTEVTEDSDSECTLTLRPPGVR